MKRPIDERVDLDFMEALRCVANRLPWRYNLKPDGYAAALGLRYGLVGAAASHHLLSTCEPGEEHEALNLIHQWPLMVEEHVRWAVLPRLEIRQSPQFATTVARHAYRPLQTYLALYRRLCPFDQSLRIAHDAFMVETNINASSGWPFFWRSKAMQRFKKAAEDSVRYARHFFERREANVDEVPEIALLDE